MKKLTITLAALLSLASLACTDDVRAEAPAKGTTLPNPVFRTVHGSVSGLIGLDAVKTLPADAVRMGVPGYPGSSFHVGAFGDAKAFAAFTKAAKRKDLDKLNVNWKTQTVLYVVFDGQTNSLDLEDFDVRGRTGTLSLRWDGIEPYYSNSTPAVIAVVSRGSLKSIEFLAGSTKLGRYSM